MLRGTVLVGGAALGGYALTMLFRSTVATLGVLFAVSIAGPLLITLLAFPVNERLMPHNNGIAVINDGVRRVDYERPGCSDPTDGGDPSRCVTVISRGDGAAYFGGLLFVAGLPSLLVFRRRDAP